METPVFAHPAHLLAGVCADLQSGELVAEGLRRTPRVKTTGGKACIEVTFGFDFETAIVPSGRISAESSGGFFPGVVEAERAAALSLVGVIRSRYQLFPADYSFVQIIEKRGVFEKMKSVLLECRRTYAELDLAANKAQSALVTLHSVLGKWVSSNYYNVSKSEIYAVSAMETVLADRAKGLGVAIKHANDVVHMAFQRDRTPDEMITFDRTVPKSVRVDWERSYHTLRCVYQEAMKKLPGPATQMFVDNHPDGLVFASVYLPGAPFSFSGSPAPTKVAAKAKLCYEVIKYVDKELHLPVLDFNYLVKRHVDLQIEQFDSKMNCIFECAEKVNEMIYDSKELIGKCSEVASPKLSGSAECDHVYFILLTNSLKMDEAIIDVNNSMTRLGQLKADRHGMEGLIAAVE